MIDPMVVDTGLKHSADNMINEFTKLAIEEFDKATLEVKPAAWSFDAVVDAIAKLNVEDESGLFLLISPADKAAFRKALRDDLNYSEGFVRTGYIGSVAGVPVIVSKAIAAGKGYLATNTVGEGFGFPNGEANSWDYLKAYDGNVGFIPNYPTNTTEVKLLYGINDTLEIKKNTPLSGFISNNKKTIHISIPLNKPLSPEVSGYEISGSLQGWHIGGYLYNPATSSAIYNLSKAASEGFSYDTDLSGSLLYLYITFDTAISAATNNTPVCVVPSGTITIKFTWFREEW